MNGLVATSERLAAEAGCQLLRAGGNAIDAALATAACLTVTEPCSNGIGGDCFALIWDGRELHGLNASGRSPEAWTPERFADGMPGEGWETVTVPGQIEGWRVLHERFGSSSFADCLAPAIDHAEQGFNPGPVTAAAWGRGLELFGHRQAFAETFALGAGRARLPDHARTLRAIATSQGRDFYEGELAAAIVQDAQAHGAALSASDLRNHRVEWVTPLGLSACGVTGWELPPNGQGIAALSAVGICEHLGLDGLQADDPQAVHLMAEAIKRAFVDLDAEVAEPSSMGCDPAALIAPERLRAWADDIDPRRARAVHRLPLPGGGTVLLVTADRDGRMVAMIQSNFRGFGSGIVVPGTGISLHNRACGFVSTPGHPNRVDGGKRPFHTIIPGFFTRESAEGHRAIGPFGCMGAEMQAQGHLQLWQRMFRWGQAPQAAIDAKRWRLERDGSLLLEPGWQPAVAQALEERGHRVREAPANRFGGAQVLMLNEAGDWEYGSESRKDGAALRC